MLTGGFAPPSSRPVRPFAPSCATPIPPCAVVAVPYPLISNRRPSLESDDLATLVLLVTVERVPESRLTLVLVLPCSLEE